MCRLAYSVEYRRTLVSERSEVLLLTASHVSDELPVLSGWALLTRQGTVQIPVQYQGERRRLGLAGDGPS